MTTDLLLSSIPSVRGVERWILGLELEPPLQDHT